MQGSPKYLKYKVYRTDYFKSFVRHDFAINHHRRELLKEYCFLQKRVLNRGEEFQIPCIAPRLLI